MLSGRQSWQLLLAVLAALAVVSFAAVADPRLRGLAINTLWLCGSVVLIAVPVGFVLAALALRTDLPGRRPLIVTTLLLLFMPLYLQASAWQAGFGQQGSLVPWLGAVLIEGWPGTIWIHAVTALPWAVLITGAALTAVERPLEESALVDMSPWQVFWRVTLPRSLPGVLVAAIWIAVMTAGEMTVTNLFLIRTFAEEMYTQLSLGESMTHMVLTGLPAWSFTALLVVCGGVAMERFLATVGGTRQSALRFELRGWRPGAALLAWGLVLLFVVVPIVSLASKAGLVVTAGSEGERIRSWSLARCLDLIVTSPVRFGRELWWSFLLGTTAATVAVAFGLLLVWATRRTVVGRAVLLLFVAIALAVPGPVVGLVLIDVLNAPGRPVLNWLYDQTVFAPVAALLVRCTAVATLITWFSLGRLAPGYFEMAALDQMSSLGQLRRIVLPLIWRGLAAAWLAAWAVALADLAATILVLPPGVDTIALRLFERLHYGAEDQVAGVSLMLVALFAVVGLAAMWLIARKSPAERAVEPG